MGQVNTNFWQVANNEAHHLDILPCSTYALRIVIIIEYSRAFCGRVMFGADEAAKQYGIHIIRNLSSGHVTYSRNYARPCIMYKAIELMGRRKFCNPPSNVQHQQNCL